MYWYGYGYGYGYGMGMCYIKKLNNFLNKNTYAYFNREMVSFRCMLTIYIYHSLPMGVVYVDGQHAYARYYSPHACVLITITQNQLLCIHVYVEYECACEYYMRYG
ncbi:hypothetical protein EON63_25105 [archaeon]|nr:MAG: hypothetical protein EON63_25105 [archaeon]